MEKGKGKRFKKKKDGTAPKAKTLPKQGNFLH
jgi:hypothetical protein